MKRFIYMLAAFALMGAVSCQPDEEVAVHAAFTTDKESYDVGDPVVLTNTSTAENALIAICKWELGKGVVSYETTPENISYDQAGEYVIKLTVTSDRGAKKSSFEKTIRVVDNNIRPVADFTWSPEKVVAGEPVQFTDLSTDEDGEVVAWEWKFGTTTSDKQNPEFTFAAQGATEVSLTVTDNKKGRNTKTVTIDVGRGAISLDLLWSYPYDDTKDAYVFGTSPAVSPTSRRHAAPRTACSSSSASPHAGYTIRSARPPSGRSIRPVMHQRSISAPHTARITIKISTTIPHLPPYPMQRAAVWLL